MPTSGYSVSVPPQRGETGEIRGKDPVEPAILVVSIAVEPDADRAEIRFPERRCCAAGTSQRSRRFALQAPGRRIGYGLLNKVPVLAQFVKRFGCDGNEVERVVDVELAFASPPKRIRDPIGPPGVSTM